MPLLCASRVWHHGRYRKFADAGGRALDCHSHGSKRQGDLGEPRPWSRGLRRSRLGSRAAARSCSEWLVAEEFWLLAAFRLQDAAESFSSTATDWLGCPRKAAKVSTLEPREPSRMPGESAVRQKLRVLVTLESSGLSRKAEKLASLESNRTPRSPQNP